MKQFLYMIAAATMLALASCSSEDVPMSPTREGEVDVVMTTTLPQALQSYAASSAESGLANLEGQNLQVRYIMEVYNNTTSTEPVVRKICYKPLVNKGDYKTASFQTRLVAAKYNFVFWADIVKKNDSYPNEEIISGISTPFYANRYFISNINPESDGDDIYHATNADTYSKGSLQEISADVQGDDSLAHLNGEMYDGYTANEVIDLRNDDINQTITLKRPFAKLRVITTDADVLDQQNIDLKTINMSLLYDATVPSTYNALTKASSGSASFNALYKNNAIYDDETENNVKTVGVMYCLIPTQVQNMTLSLYVLGSSIYDKISIDVDNVPLVANKLTTIRGNLFSKSPNITINIVDEFDQEETIVEYGKEASNVDDLKTMMSGRDETITYTGNVSKDSGFELDFTNVMKPVTYSAEGTTPVYGENNNSMLTLAFSSVDEGAVLTFKGTNAPKKLRIKTGKKISIRIDLPDTYVEFADKEYKYIVSKVSSLNYTDGAVYDAMFSNVFFYSENLESHIFSMGDGFTVNENEECQAQYDHMSGSCDFLTKVVKPWFDKNNKTSIWDFVGDTNN